MQHRGIKGTLLALVTVGLVQALYLMLVRLWGIYLQYYTPWGGARFHIWVFDRWLARFTDLPLNVCQSVRILFIRCPLELTFVLVLGIGLSINDIVSAALSNRSYWNLTVFGMECLSYFLFFFFEKIITRLTNHFVCLFWQSALNSWVKNNYMHMASLAYFVEVKYIFIDKLVKSNVRI